MLALSVPKPITHDSYPQAPCNLYPFHNDLGHILQSILSLICIIHRVTPPYIIDCFSKANHLTKPAQSP